MAINERDNAESNGAGRRDLPPRKPWHAPRFVITSVAATDAQKNAGGDAGTPSMMLS